MGAVLTFAKNSNQMRIFEIETEEIYPFCLFVCISIPSSYHIYDGDTENVRKVPE